MPPPHKFGLKKSLKESQGKMATAEWVEYGAVVVLLLLTLQVLYVVTICQLVNTERCFGRA